MSERIHVTVEVDTDELRKWADKHADLGNHGVAHVLYKAASDGESLSEQAIRAAVETERERVLAFVHAEWFNGNIGGRVSDRIVHAARADRMGGAA